MNVRRPIPPDLAGGTAVVTGGAQGIGRGIADELAARGARVVVMDLPGDALDDAAAAGLVTVAGNVRSDEDVARLKDVAGEDVHFVAANAGIAVDGEFEAVPLEEWIRIHDVNVLGAVRVIGAFLPAFRGHGSGWFLLTSASEGLFPDDPLRTPYSATKAALLAIGRSLAVQIAPDGIGVTVLCPRLTDTGLGARTVTWMRRGKRTASDIAAGEADSVADVVARALDDVEAGRFLSSLTPGTAERLIEFAEDPEEYLERLHVGDGA